MDKKEHGRRLAAAMAAKAVSRKDVAEVVGRKVRTITNWTSGAHMPSPDEREILRRMFPGYDSLGDPVVVAVLGSDLTEDRQQYVIGYYKEKLREQREAAAS
jgi:transcriptional regulator with XRE-family HTH domain